MSPSVFAGALSKMFKQVSPAVVILHTFEKVPTPNPDKGLASVEGLGSGVLISEDGKILTAAHVVQVAEAVHVEFIDGRKSLAKVVATVPSADIALLQLDRIPKDVTVAPLGDSDKVSVGDDVFVIGAPYGASHTLTAGFISAKRGANSDVGFTVGEFFQTDAAINQGNSGGPLFNMRGEVIGIVSYIMTQSGGFEGLGFALTSNTAKQLVLDERSFWSGIDAKLISGRLAQIFQLPQATGLLVERVAQGSPADAAGIQGGDVFAQIADMRLLLGGDIILKVEDVTIGDDNAEQRIRESVQKKKPGETVSVIVYRQGKKLTLKAPL